MKKTTNTIFGVIMHVNSFNTRDTNTSPLNRFEINHVNPPASIRTIEYKKYLL